MLKLKNGSMPCQESLEDEKVNVLTVRKSNTKYTAEDSTHIESKLISVNMG